MKLEIIEILKTLDAKIEEIKDGDYDTGDRSGWVVYTNPNANRSYKIWFIDDSYGNGFIDHCQEVRPQEKTIVEWN